MLNFDGNMNTFSRETQISQIADNVCILLCQVSDMLNNLNELTSSATRESDNGKVTRDENMMLTVADIEVNTSDRSVSRSGVEINLSDAEFDLLALLVRNAGTILHRDEIYRTLRGLEYDGLDRGVDQRISSIRKQLGDTAAPFQYIKTVRGKGYLFRKNYA